MENTTLFIIFSVAACMLIIFLIMGISYIKNVLFLRSKIEETGQERLWPLAWRWISFAPIIGNMIYHRLEKLPNRGFDLKLTRKRESFSNPVPFDNTNWILLQEQYDRKTSAHHGTRLRFLATDRGRGMYEMISPGRQNELRNFPASKIIVEAARTGSVEVSWGYLNHQRGTGWLFTNNRTNNLVLIMRGSNNTITDVCPPLQSQILQGNDKFMIGLSEFQLLLLPNLYLAYEKVGKSERHLLDENSTITCGSRKDATLVLDGSAHLHWKIEGRILTVHDEVQYTRAVSGLPVALDNGKKIVVAPGDRFRIPQTDSKFWIDC